MINYKIDNVASTFLQQNGGSHKYRYQGKNYKITEKFLENAPTGLQQSFGNFASKNCKKDGQGKGKGKPGKGDGKPKPGEVKDGEETDQDIPDVPEELKEKPEKGKDSKKEGKKASNTTGGRTTNPAKITSNQVVREAEVKKHILRWANTDTIIQGPLDMPKVFKALITEPHTAFDYRKNVMETETNLTLFVDTAVGYHNKDKFLHNTIINVAKKIKGVNIFSGHALCNIEYKGERMPYYTDIVRALPKKQTRKIIIFTQGCGHTPDDTYKDLTKKMYFCTCFEPKCTCGCEQIPKAEAAGLNMNYKILSIEDLAKINPVLVNF